MHKSLERNLLFHVDNLVLLVSMEGKIIFANLAIEKFLNLKVYIVESNRGQKYILILHD